MTGVPTEDQFRRDVLTFLEATLPAKGEEPSGVVSMGTGVIPANGLLAAVAVTPGKRS